MRLLVCGGAGFIGSTFVRQRVTDFGDDVTVLDKLTYAGRRENLQDVDATASLRARRRSRTATRSPSAIGRRRRGRQLRRRDARRPLDRRARRVRDHARARAPTCCSRRRASAGVRYVQVSTDEVYGSIEEGSFTEAVAAAPVLALLRDEGGRGPAGRLLPPHVRARGADLPRLEQLRAVPVPGEADPADGAQRAARRQAARLRRRPAGAQLDLRRRTSRAGSASRSSTASPARSTTSAAPTSAPTSRSSSGSSSYTGADDELIEYVTDRPGHDRRYSLSSDKIRALGWEPQVHFADGLERTVDWYRENALVVGADPLGRLPRVLRAPVRALAGLSRLAATATSARQLSPPLARRTRSVDRRGRRRRPDGPRRGAACR